MATIETEGADVQRDFALLPLERIVDVVSSSVSLTADDSKEVVVTAIVRDAEGRRFANQTVSWSTNSGSIINAGLQTDVVGEVTAVVRCAATDQPIVTVQYGTSAGRASLP